MGGNLERGWVFHLEGLGGPLNLPGSGLTRMVGFHKNSQGFRARDFKKIGEIRLSSKLSLDLIYGLSFRIKAASYFPQSWIQNTGLILYLADFHGRNWCILSFYENNNQHWALFSTKTNQGRFYFHWALLLKSSRRSCSSKGRAFALNYDVVTGCRRSRLQGCPWDHEKLYRESTKPTSRPWSIHSTSGIFNSLINSFIPSLVNSFIHSFILPSFHCFNHSFILSIIH